MDKPHLYRSRRNRMIAGVAGGLADYFDLDLALVRLLWVIAFFLGGGGLFVYILAWIIIPEEKDLSYSGHQFTENSETQISVHMETGEKDQAKSMQYKEAKEKNRRIAGAVLIGVGILLLINRSFHFFLLHNFWPLLLIGLGLYVLVQKAKGE